ncbi:MAG: accessory factor UbiK family protein [Betaproteobacteria bacterium]|nr:accessory factor UbiK family protein [Betaproteobacteria bacterium]
MRIQELPSFSYESVMSQKFAEDLMSKFSGLLANSPAKGLDRNAKALFASFFSHMNLVTREEFDIQRELLAQTREKLETLEAKVSQLEAARSAPGPRAASDHP